MTGKANWTVRKPPPDGFRLAPENVRLPPGPLPHWLLYHRGVKDASTAAKYLQPDLDDLQDPMAMPAMDVASEAVWKAASAGEAIGICGDFDVDGLSGTALVAAAIRALGGRPVPYIPHREQDGHGISLGAIAGFKGAGVRLMVTVDTGTNASDEVAAALDAGIRTVITDHHLPDSGHALPRAVAIVNPHLGGDGGPALSGSGVALKLAQAVCGRAGVEPPDDAIALAALGIISDSAPLSGDNRLIVKFGLEQLGMTRHPGLRALLDHSRRSGTDGAPDTQTVAFYIAPRLNSAGRLGDAGPSLRLLTTDDSVEAEAMAARLDALNTERQRLGEIAWKQAEEQLPGGAGDRALIAVRCRDMPPGLLGPLAGKLCERFARPAVAMCESDGYVRASARSVPGFDVHAAVSSQAALLERFGGHARAAGFTMRPENVEKVLNGIEQLAAWARLNSPALPEVEADADVRLEELGVSMWDFVRAMAPFGEGNSEPVLMARGLQVSEVRTMGATGKHLRMVVGDGERSVNAIGFGMGDVALGNGRIDAAFTLRSDVWNGRLRREIQLKALRPSGRR